jgi:hypothetical protein
MHIAMSKATEHRFLGGFHHRIYLDSQPLCVVSKIRTTGVDILGS